MVMTQSPMGEEMPCVTMGVLTDRRCVARSLNIDSWYTSRSAATIELTPRGVEHRPGTEVRACRPAVSGV
jgi:hypothetical protein